MPIKTGWFAVAELDHRMGPGLIKAIAAHAPQEAVPSCFRTGGTTRWCLVVLEAERAEWVRDWTQEASLLLGKTAISFLVWGDRRSVWVFHAGDFIAAIEQEGRRHVRLLGDFDEASRRLHVAPEVFHRYRFEAGEDGGYLTRAPAASPELIHELGLSFPSPDAWTEVRLPREAIASHYRPGQPAFPGPQPPD